MEAVVLSEFLHFVHSSGFLNVKMFATVMYSVLASFFDPDEPVPSLPGGQEPPASLLPDAVPSSSSLPLDGSAAVPERVRQR